MLPVLFTSRLEGKHSVNRKFHNKHVIEVDFSIGSAHEAV